jgi:hypothetical protein
MRVRRAVGYQPTAFGSQVASCGKANTRATFIYFGSAKASSASAGGIMRKTLSVIETIT